jgi:polyisoprenoid-binding protein YceI
VVLDVEGLSASYRTPYGTTVRGIHATGKIIRKDFEITWNKALDNGGVLVGNEVSLDLNAEVVEKKPPAADTTSGKPAAAPAK